jgi:hypothetical protein
MRWFRSNERFGSWCALLALTVQLVLSFGHVHITGSLRTSASFAAATQPGANPDDPSAPSKQPGSADFCAICAAIHLAGLTTADPPALPIALLSRSERLTARLEARSAETGRLPFNARAPPIA